MRRPQLPFLLFLVVLGSCWPRLQALPAPRFAASGSQVSPGSATAETKTELLPRAGDSAHAVTLAMQADGRLMAAWFSGTREGADDVAIYASRYDGAMWSAPQRIVDRQQAAQDTKRLVRKLGNPVLWRDAQGVLHLWFVSVSYGGWAGSAINHMQSHDDGRQWSRAERIISSPFWNLSTLVRTPPLALADGGIALPIYHEFLNKRPELLRFGTNLRLLDKARMPGASGSLQPAVVAMDVQRALALMRDASHQQRIHAARSDDGGNTWQTATATALPNPNAAIALLRLHDGSLLLACNPLTSDRNQLALLRSRDEGKSWSPPWIVEQGGVNDEFSYPALLQDAGGTLHLAYTWKRQSIKHVALPWARIEGLQ